MIGKDVMTAADRAKEHARKVGRPKGASGVDRRDNVYAIYFTRYEAARIIRLARKAKKQTCAYLRDIILKEVN